VNLVDLNISNNQLIELPGSIGDMKSLVSLDASDNLIETVGSGISSAKNLKIMLLANNKIKEFPGQVLESPKLERLRLEGNMVEKDGLMSTKGYEVFELRRQAAISKQLAGGMQSTDRTICGL